ncbi:TetR/AcrR family transcriptional regulator [Streptomyces sp. TRM66268-LWL]|uniref:TetR/AcrR family transcriptional regulator n=1 Tax=Streptomyces polyasparticus TaxID=2767826 RepID=A0ABR7SCV4_9ACTN|nr:TetR/AcrR family transcriptional regulator [Streptomyces polyasparticus]MBC9712316.1 TetR/AcrR family transcriptional regulator [Streptomyces polyasparticus]
MPTGVAIRDVREQLFAAAERVLLRDGPSALTSRAVTTEAGCAKGVLHRHFADFDEFLAELVRNRIVRVRLQAHELWESAGTGGVTANLAGALTEVFGSVAVALVGLITSRDVLRARLRASTPSGVPLLSEATEMIASYLTAEQEYGRIAAEADVSVLAPTLVGAGHLIFADRHSGQPAEGDVARVVSTVIGPVVRWTP